LDALTLSFSALVLAELGFTRRLGTARAWTVALAATLAPDLDGLLRFFSPVPVHGLAGGRLHALPVAMGVLVPVLTLLAARFPGRRRQPVLPCLLLVLSCVCTHLALDVLGTSGARVFWPWSPQRLALDWLSSPEPVLWVLLSMVLWLRLLVPDATRAAIHAVVWSALYVGLEGGAHGVAQRRAGVWARLEGFDAERVMAFPDGVGGLFWNTVAFNEEDALQRPVALFGQPQPGFKMARGLEEPLLMEFLATPIGGAWRDNARVPLALSETLPQGGYVVYVRDLRHAGRRATTSGVLPNDLRARFDTEGQLSEHGVPPSAPPFPQPPRPPPEPAPRTP